MPKDFERTSAWQRLADHGWKKPVKPDDLDPLRRLTDNGVLAEQSDDPEFLRFALDPIAEMLAARKWGRDCRDEDRRKECACWDELEQKVKEKEERAEGFLMALHMVRQKYGPPCDQNAETANA